jgi:hypothetical protein
LDGSRQQESIVKSNISGLEQLLGAGLDAKNFTK